MLPNLDNAQPTLQNLHTVARLLGAMRLMVFERKPNFLELGLKIVPEGLSTDVLPNGGEVTLDFRQLALVYRSVSGESTRLPISGQAQAALLEALLQTTHTNELDHMMPLGERKTYADAMYSAAEGFVNRIKPKQADLSGQTPLHFDAQAAQDYANALYAIFTGVARFRARMDGAQSPVVVWPEHFDLSFLWFAAEADEHRSHLNFGFAPYSAGIEYPYLYAYAYPYPAQYTTPNMPAGAGWHTQGWTGAVLPYSAIAKQQHAEQFVEATCEAIYRELRPMLG